MVNMAVIMRMDTITMSTNQTSLVRLMQLVSPSLPIGAFAYSQGLEWAVECGWINDSKSFKCWLEGLIFDSLERLDVPVFSRLYQACERQDESDVAYWSHYLLASRETSELRMEEKNRARALTRLLVDLELQQARQWQGTLQTCQAAPFAVAAVNWKIRLDDAASGYVWSWLENQIAAAIKLVPLGQTEGQRLQLILSEKLAAIVQQGLKLEDREIGASAPALAIASSLHETQYTRLFRS